MASHDYKPQSGRARIFFRYAGRQFNRTIAVGSDREAYRACALIEETIQDVERGKVILPPDADPVAFFLSGGKVVAGSKPVSNPFKPVQEVLVGPATLGQTIAVYQETLTPGSKEANSVLTEGIHARHFSRLIGDGAVFADLDLNVVQTYVDARAREGIGRETLRKELSTLRVIWGWAFKRGHVLSPLAWKMKDLTFPKADEKEGFQTWDQVTRKIERGGLSEKTQASLWASLWLDQNQTRECLSWVNEQDMYPFIHPMFAFAAYTGARRSEMLRSVRDDWDFEAGVVSIRQKKADKSKTFTRRSVPIHPDLAKIIASWFEKAPACSWSISTLDGAPIGPRMSTKYFRETVKGGKWSVLHGWHTFRHSLASNMASAGVDQRIINEILGHNTEEMERRYRHLLPTKTDQALRSLYRAG